MNTKLILLPLFSLLIAFGTTGCKEPGCRNVNACNYDVDATSDDGSCINKGQVTFWQDSTGNQYDITVTVNATEANITSSFATTPLCDASGSATFALCPGSHNYTAREVFPGTATWTGNAVSVQNGCTAIRLN